MKEVTGILLAGGKNSRMNHQPKGLLQFGKKTFAEQIIENLKRLTSGIIISANTNDYNHLGYPVYSDLIHDKGPLGGIFTALSASKTKKNLIIACDMPFASEDLMKYLLEQSHDYDAVVPEFNQRLHPLMACYSSSALNKINHFVKNNVLKMHEVVKGLNTNIVRVDHLVSGNEYNALSNINTPEEYQKLISE